ncbi:ATP-grasp domain-containing protein [Lutispora sp.]|uniref:ATP-grasp domain-containing protein n=1 Tax=Lutispora sp. TaxID=2828727 RepID=UPI00356A7202
MKEQAIAIVLGGTNPHIALINNLKRRGYYTVLVDYYDNPPAKEAADEHIKESTLDKDKVLEIARSISAKLVISACVDQANVTACYVAEKLGLPAPYSYKTALEVTDKGLMKRKMIDSGIPTARHIYADGVEAFEQSELKFPIVVKPADSNGSAGVRKANSYTELSNYIGEALKISRNGKVILEEFKEGVEISLDFFVQNMEPHLIMIREKFKMINKEGSAVLQSPGSITPGQVSPSAREKATKIAKKIVDTFDLKNTSLLIQAIVKGDDVNIIEFAPRVGGGLSYRTVKLNTGFDILDATVDSYLGIKTELKYEQPKSYYSTNIIYALPGVFESVTGYEELIEDKVIKEFYFYKTKGMQIGADMSTKSRVGAFLVQADNKQELFEKMKIAIDRLEVYDSIGNPIMRKDIYPI